MTCETFPLSKKAIFIILIFVDFHFQVPMWNETYQPNPVKSVLSALGRLIYCISREYFNLTLRLLSFRVPAGPGATWIHAPSCRSARIRSGARDTSLTKL